MKVLLIEDDEEMASYIVSGLAEKGCAVGHIADGSLALVLVSAGEYDVAVVDRMLPGVDGLSLVKAMRGAGMKLPVLFLTTMAGIDDRVEGLNAGGDDYLVKPFALGELSARLHAIVRRPALAAATTLRVADLEMDLLKRTVVRSGRKIELQPREFQLLEFLMRQAGRIVTRTMLLEQVWDFHFDPKTNIVETHVSRLRAKVDRDFTPELIQTIRGSGYSLRAPE